MIRHDFLNDPIERTHEMKAEEFLKYVEIRDRQPKVVQTKPELVKEIRDIFYNSHDDIELSMLDKNWGYMKKRIESNEGLAQFVLDYDGAKSNFFFPWLNEVSTSPSGALEMAYNSGYNLNGEWIVDVPKNDEINFFVRNDPTFVYNRERQLFVADLVMTSQDNATASNKSKVVDFGAGRLAWARKHGFKFQPEVQTILAFDIDQSFSPQDLFEQKLDELGIIYETKNFMSELRDPRLMGADLVILGGVASYYPIDMFGEKVIRPIYELLKPNGTFFFDLQLHCPYYLRSVKVFDWPEIRLMPNASTAIEAIETMRKNLWSTGMKFSVQYSLDTYNEVPSSIMITLTKV